MHHKPVYRLYETTVQQVVDVTPRMRRVTLGGDDLAEFSSDRPGQWVKLFFDDGVEGRAFTIRAWRPARREIDIDFVIHGHGLAGRWAASAKPGLIVQLAGPRGEFRHAPGKKLFLLGDETAIPAITAILEEMNPAERVVVAVEVSTPSAVQPLPVANGTPVSWIISGAQPGLVLARYAVALTVSPETSQMWVACEATAARDLRYEFGRIGFDRSALHVSGYWKCGEIEYVDQDSDY